MGKTKTLHFVRCYAHYQGFTRAYLVIRDTPPFCNSIHIQSFWDWYIDLTFSLSPSSFMFMGECLVGAVIARSDEAVEAAVVEVDKPFLELVALVVEPLCEAVADFVNLCIGKLYRLRVGNKNVLAVRVLAY
ncbi:hypothetical protein E7745_00010 [Duncaniella sp. C9]|nr:hypothetical protein E7745_00010 [Duncaniella sp. C9]